MLVALAAALAASSASMPLYAHDAGLGLVRYTADGNLDAGFGHGGVVAERTPQGGLSPEALVIQADGKVVLVGTSSDLATAAVGFGIARYGPDGIVDSTFGAAGRVLSRIGAATAEAHAVALQPDGQIVVAGSGFAATTGVSDFAVARYTADGSLDPSFGENGSGFVLTQVSASGAEARAIALQPDGRVVVAGTAFASGTSNDSLALERYTADGSPDASFGSGGSVITTFDTDSGPVRAAALLIQADGELVAVGSVGGHQGAFVLARYLPTGDLDVGFGNAGKANAVAASPGQASAQAYAAAIQPDGNIVVAGGLGSASNDNVAFALARYRPNGDQDASFASGAGPFVTTTFEGGGSGAHAVTVESDGKIVAVGSGRGAFAVVRYLPSGAPDQGFGTSGVALTTVGDAGSMPAALGVQRDGKLVAAGLTYFLVPTSITDALTSNPLVLVSVVGLLALAGLGVAHWTRKRAKRPAGSRTGRAPGA